MTVLSLLLALTLLAVTVLIHYEALAFTGRRLQRSSIRPRKRVLVAIFACLGAHLAEVALFAAAFAALRAIGGFGSIEGVFEPGATDFLYFSLTNYTTLGVGDAYATGALRLLVGIEALAGFLMITWSASFGYLTMQRYWHPREED
ncbi:MAG: two pore domain potassium channel family protein [Alphaproteobacteria bacterium HGW-Alphaproteobacteria-2]|nr:MAG: two pore domain potassium channel family protein [Alphaproteobacteria bacterium HGW-Alphaproteobacteria-2]